MEKLLYFWVDKSHKRATNSTGIRANGINCLLYILKVLLNLHNFPLLNINCTEPYLGPLYRSYIIVQISNCKIPERVLLNGAICKRFSKVSRRWRCAACHLLQVFNSINSGGVDVILAFIDDEEEIFWINRSGCYICRMSCQQLSIEEKIQIILYTAKYMHVRFNYDNVSFVRGGALKKMTVFGGGAWKKWGLSGGGVMVIRNGGSKNSTSPTYLVKNERSLRPLLLTFMILL